MHASIEAIHDFHKNYISLVDIRGCKNMIFFLNAQNRPVCMCIDFGLCEIVPSMQAQFNTPIERFHGDNAKLSSKDVELAVMPGFFFTDNVWIVATLVKHVGLKLGTAKNLMQLGFTAMSAEIIVNWQNRNFNSFGESIKSEQRFLKELESIPQTNNLHLPRTSNRLTLVPEPNAYAKALAIQDELNAALMQLRNIDIPIY